MKKEKENKELDVDERAITLTVDDEVIRKVCSGEIRHISLDINNHNYREILENNDGNLILVVDVMPETFHGCYLYNNGEFPYAIKSTLEFLVLKGDNDFCLARIIDVDTAAGTRFRFKGPGEPSVAGDVTYAWTEGTDDKTATSATATNATTATIANTVNIWLPK